MRIHKEGFNIIAVSALIIPLFLAINYFWTNVFTTILLISGIVLVFLIMRFFRVPKRIVTTDENTVFAPADGKVVVVEEVFEPEYLNRTCIQVSVFMTIWNVHINWFPVSGIVKYFKHHHGEFMVAWHPKSSEKNERTTTVVETKKGQEILFRQIAGLVARRIVSYAAVGQKAEQNTECGFIKFGSRVDLLLPIDSEIQVKLGDKVTGSQTVIAKLNSKPVSE